MKRWWLVVAMFVSRFAWAAPDIPALPPLPPGMASSVPVSAPVVPLKRLPPVRNGAFDLRFVNVGQVVDLVYGDALHVPHVISDDVLQDTRLVSFQFDSSKGDLRDFFAAFLDSQGFEVVTRNGVDFVSKRTGERPGDRETLVYTPHYRSASYLIGLVQSLFAGRVTGSVSGSGSLPSSHSSGSAAAPLPASGSVAAVPVAASGVMPVSQAPVVSAADVLVFMGTPADVKQVKSVLAQVDTGVGQVVVRGWTYEVDDTDDSNSGFSVVSKLLGVGLQVSSGSTSSDTNALTFSAGRLSFAISALSEDSRFHEMSAPNVRCVSGEQVELNVGQQVPTVSSVSYEGASGTPVQSISYQDAGVIFNVTPTVLQDAIELKVDEEISSFVNTTTGVSGSPTKNTRSLQTVTDLKDGEVIVLGGLIQDSDTVSDSHEGFLPHFLDGHTKSKSRTEVVLVLQVQKVSTGEGV